MILDLDSFIFRQRQKAKTIDYLEHLLDVKNKGSNLSKPVARHFNLPGHSHKHMEICGIYLHLGNNETRKRKEQRLIFKLGTLAPNGINERFSFA